MHPCVDCTAIYKIRVGVCVANFSTLGIWFFVSSRNTVGRTPYDPYSPYSLPNMMLKLSQRNRGHFVTLFYLRKHLIVGIFLERSRLLIYQEDAMNFSAVSLVADLTD